MERSRLADDTSADIEARQIEAWRRMSPDEKAALVTALVRSTRDMAVAGIRSRHPEATDREVFLRLAILNLGRDLAARAYPEIDALRP